MPQQNPRMFGRTFWTVVGFVVFFFLLACSGVPLDLVRVLLSGSVTFLWRVIPQLQVRWDLVISTAVYVLLLLVGAHFFLRWLYGKLSSQTAPADAVEEDPRGLKPTLQMRAARWRFGWTLRGFGIVLLMFVSGTAMVGITHQTVWLARSPEPMFARRSRTQRIHCASNLKAIGQRLFHYASQHAGNYPDDVRPLVLEEDLTGSVFICPSGNAERTSTATTREAENLLKPQYNDYLYLGKGLKEPLDPNQIVAIDRPGNHGLDGINVLFGDGRVEWQYGETMRKTLEVLKLSAEGTRSAR